MRGSLDTETDGIDATCVEVLGDPIRYSIGGISIKSIYAYVDHSDKTQTMAGTQLTDQDIWIEVLKRDVPNPGVTDRIELPQMPGLTLMPREWRHNRDGRMWHIYLKRAR